MSETPTSPKTSGKISTGITALDGILHGGMEAGRLYLVEGLPGSGKTTLAMQFLLEGKRRGEPCVYIALSESAEELQATAESHGWSLDGIRLYEMSAAADNLLAESQQSIYRPSDIELGEVTRPMLEALEQEKPARIVFDSMSEMRFLAGDPLRYRRQMLMLKQYFSRHRCTVLYLDDLTEHHSDLQLHSVVHGVIRLDRLPVVYGSTRRQLSVIKVRGSTFRDGTHDYKIETGGLRIFPRLAAAEHRGQPVPREPVSSGIVELDALLGGGPLRGTSMLLLGPAGVGKSVLASQYCSMAGDRGEKSAIFLFDETRRTILDRTDQLHMALHKHVEEGLARIYEMDPAELSPGEFAHMICHAVECDCVRQIRIDTLNGYLDAMPEERYLLLQLHKLLAYLSRRGVLTLLVASQHGVIGEELASGVNVSYLADTLVLMRFFEAAGHVRRAISVVKKRSGGHEESIREYRIDSDGLHFGPPLEQFEGVLTGNPVYRGGHEKLMDGSHERERA